jgi:hypothetical protein
MRLSQYPRSVKARLREDRLMGSNGWKIALVLVLVAGAGFLAYRNTRGPKGPSKDVNFVCCATGKMYNIARDQVVGLPSVNPDTGEETLLPCSLGEDGLYRVSERNRPYVERLGEKNKFVDEQTLVVRTEG